MSKDKIKNKMCNDELKNVSAGCGTSSPTYKIQCKICGHRYKDYKNTNFEQTKALCTRFNKHKLHYCEQCGNCLWEVKEL